MTKYYLYILYSSQINQYYIGISHDPEKILTYHNSAPKGWTRRGRSWKLVFKKEFANQTEARKWEKNIKDQKRWDIIEVIIQNKFHWGDLWVAVIQKLPQHYPLFYLCNQLTFV